MEAINCVRGAQGSLQRGSSRKVLKIEVARGGECQVQGHRHHKAWSELQAVQLLECQVDKRKNELSSSTFRRALTGPGPMLPALHAPLPSRVRAAL